MRVIVAGLGIQGHKRRHVAADDVVATVAWLCSDAAGFVTGETLKVSGGYPLGI